MTIAASAPAFPPSRLVRFLWWCQVLTPFVGLLFSIASGLVVDSADENVGAIMAMAPLLFLTFGAALLTLLKAALDGHQTARHRITIAALALLTIPMVLLIAAMWEFFGWPDAFESLWGSLVCLVGTVATTWFLMAIRPPVWSVEAERWSP